MPRRAVQNDKVGIRRLGLERDVAAAEVIVFQLFQPIGKTPLAGSIELPLRANREKRAICTFLGSGPVQTVASQRNRDRVRSCCA